MTTADLIRLKNKGGYILKYDYGQNRFTIKLKDLIEQGFEMFDDSYDLTEAYKDRFEELFIETYLMQEIGFPTVDEFKRQVYLDLKRECKKFNVLIANFETAISLDPLVNQKLTTSAVVASLTGSTSTNKFNDLPKGKITAITDGYLTSLGETSTDANSDVTSETVFEGFTEAQINLIENYNRKLEDMLVKFVDLFAKNFMQLLVASY